MKKNDFQLEEEIDLKKYYLILLRKWYWFVFAFLLCLPAAFVINRYSSDTFFTYSTLLIKDQSLHQNSINDIVQQMSGITTQGKKSLETEIGVLKSYYLSRKTIGKLDFGISYFKEGQINDVEIYKETPFKIILNPSHRQEEFKKVEIEILNENFIRININGKVSSSKKIQFDTWFENADFSFKVVKGTNLSKAQYHTPYYFKINNLEKVALQYQSQLKVDLSNEDASIIVLSIKGNLVYKNIDFLNQLLIEYMQDGLDDKNQIAQNTINFIDLQLNRIDDSLQLAEGNLQMFRQDNKIIDLSKEGSVLFEKLEEQQKQRSLLEVKLKYYNYLLEYIDKRTDFKDIITPSIMGINDQLLNKLVTDLSSWNQEKKVMEYSIKSNNPQIDILNVRIKNTLESLIEVVNNIIQGAKIEKSSIDNKINQLNAEIAKLPQTERNMIGIKRKFDLNDNIYNFLQQKRAEAGIASASNTSDCKVLDWASETSTFGVSFRKIINYVIALLLSLIVPAIIIIIIDSRNNTIRDKSEIETGTKLPISGLIPRNLHGIELVVSEKQNSFIAESFRVHRTNLRYIFAEKKSSIITVSSMYSGEGKTFYAANLASIIALSGKKVVVIGFDLRNPQIHKTFGVSIEKGVSSYLTTDISLETITKPTKIKNLDIITAGALVLNPSELIESDKTEKLLAEAKTRYDYIILDTPPAALVTDALLLFPYADLNLFVIRLNHSERDAIHFANTLCIEKKIHNMQIVINDVNNKSLTNKHNKGKYYNDDIADRTSFFKRMFSKNNS